MRSQSRIIIFYSKSIRLQRCLFTAIGTTRSNKREKEKCSEKDAAYIQSPHHTIFSKERLNESKHSRHQKLQLADREIVRGMPRAMELPEAYQ